MHTVTDPITKMEVPHTMGPDIQSIISHFWLKSYENGQELDKTHQCAVCC